MRAQYVSKSQHRMYIVVQILNMKEQHTEIQYEWVFFGRTGVILEI